MTVYELCGVNVSHVSGARTITVLEGLDLTVGEGEFLTLVGPSGSGKTTVLNLLAGFLAPTRGRVLYRGSDLATLTPSRAALYRNREIGMIHQFFNLLPDLTALQNAMLPALIAGASRAEAEGRARKLLDRVGVGSRADHRPSEMSGGEQQRVAISRALINDPAVLLGDEPTGNLDAGTTRDILSLLEELHAERGGVVLLATHDPEVASRGTRCLDLARAVA